MFISYSPEAFASFIGIDRRLLGEKPLYCTTGGIHIDICRATAANGTAFPYGECYFTNRMLTNGLKIPRFIDVHIIAAS